MGEFTGDENLKKRLIEQIDNIEEKTGCWNLHKNLKSRYGSTRVDEITYLTHRLSYIVFNGNIKDGLNVLHRCDNTKCINPSHLFLGTHRDNMDDRNNKGRQARGEGTHSAKLKEADVKDMRKLYGYGISMKSIADMFSMDSSTVSRIISRQRWKHI